MSGHRQQRQSAMNAAPSMAARLRVGTLFATLDRIAHKVRADRNAKGAPKRLRARLRAEMRPELRTAIGHAKRARAALVAGDEQAFEAARALAWLALQTAQTIFSEPFRERAAKADKAGRLGGRPSKDDQTAEWVRRYERMKKTHRSLTAQERYEAIASDDLRSDVKWRTVRNRISEYLNRQK